MSWWGGSDSDNRASLSSTCTSLPTGTELGNKPVRDEDTKEEDDDFEEQSEKDVLSNTLMEKTP